MFILKKYNLASLLKCNFSIFYESASIFSRACNHFKSCHQEDTKWGGLKAGQVMLEPKPVFARIETATEEKAQESSKAAKGGKKKACSEGLVEV